MAIENVNQLSKGQTVRFRTKSPHDNVLWTGKITAVCDYDIARKFQDIDTYYQDVLKVEPSMGARESRTYLILRVSENGATATERVFALEWLNPATVEVVVENTYVDIRVYDINKTKAEDVMTAIAAMGYTSKIVTSTT